MFEAAPDLPGVHLCGLSKHHLGGSLAGSKTSRTRARAHINIYREKELFLSVRARTSAYNNETDHFEVTFVNFVLHFPLFNTIPSVTSHNDMSFLVICLRSLLVSLFNPLVHLMSADFDFLNVLIGPYPLQQYSLIFFLK